MNVQTVSPASLRRVGLEALARALGPVGMARFLQQFEIGEGDYTRDRDQWLGGMDVKGIIKEIKNRRRTS